MHVLITGAEGQVGSEVLGRATNHKVTGTTLVELDITSATAVARAIADHDPDVVINAAAYTAVDRAEQEADAAFAVNRDGAANVARACADREIPLIHLSTDYVFGGERQDRLVETDRTYPLSVYGRSKLGGEAAIREVLPEHVILRTSWVFGTTGANFVKTMLRLARERDELRIVDDQTGCPTWAGDIADTIWTLVGHLPQRDAMPWGTYHYCGAPAVTWFEFATAIFERAYRRAPSEAPRVVPISTKDYPTPAPRPLYSVLSCAKMESTFGIHPPPWGRGLDEVMNELAHG